MDFLKIAIGENVKLSHAIEWPVVPFSKQSNPSELGVIVLNDHDLADLKLARNLQETSGLGIPIIQTNSVDDVTDKVINAIKAYQNKMVPGFLNDLIQFAEDKPISFTTPGHHNGQYYEKHPAGVVFNRFFGKNLMFADTSDTVDELGDR